MARVPGAGNVVWLQFTARAGHERAAGRPAAVLDPAPCSSIGLLLCCPRTTRIKGHPFEVPVTGDTPSVVPYDRVERLDWRARAARRKGWVAYADLAAVRARAGALIRGQRASLRFPTEGLLPCAASSASGTSATWRWPTP